MAKRKVSKRRDARKRVRNATDRPAVAQQRTRAFWPYGLAIFALLLTADQYAKRIVIGLLPQGGSIAITDWLRFTYVQNTGTLWGSLQGANWAFILLSAIAFAFLLRYHDRFTTLVEKVALWMLVAGLWGNLIDRVTLGFVIDYIDLGWWPVFNIADASIVAGVALFLLETIRLERVKKSPQV